MLRKLALANVKYCNLKEQKEINRIRHALLGDAKVPRKDNVKLSIQNMYGRNNNRVYSRPKISWAFRVNGMA
jgi:hypothetical protein